MTIIKTLTEKGFTMALEGERLAISPKANLTADLREFIRANKRQLVSELQTKIYVPKNNDELADFQNDYFHEVLNRFIENGITFKISADDFQIVDPAQILKTSDKEFLKLNGAAILCNVQQSLLTKHLFSHSPEQFEDFSFEIAEREAIMTGDGRESFSIHCEAVKSTTRKWFEDLLEKKDIAGQGFDNKNGSTTSKK
jgi:hypothetical protein